MSQQTLAQFVIQRNVRQSPRRSPLQTLHRTAGIDGLSASPMSPDEEVIRQRGQIRTSPRKRAFQTSTPALADITDKSLLDVSLNTSTSTTGARTPTRKSAADGVRKRLMLSTSYVSSDPEDSPCPKGLTPSNPKKRKTTKANKNPSLTKRLSALSSDQLAELLDNLISNHPELQEEIESELPKPDTSKLIETLEYLKKNIFKSLPYSRWGSSRDAFCFRRVKTHVGAFKSTCINQGKQLQDASSWEASLEYILQAWEVVSNMPDWDNIAHNKSKEMCYRTLATQCKKSLKESSLDKKTYEDLKERIEAAIETNDQIAPCLEIVNKKIQKAS